MRFAFTDQQIAFRDAVRQVLAKECPPDAVRAAYESPAPKTARWATLAELGVTGLTVPGDHGGLGLAAVDLVLLVEEAGRVALPEPLGMTTGVAAPVLAELVADDPDGRVERWLADIAAGSVTVAVDLGDPGIGRPVAGADGADVLLLAHGSELHGVAAADIAVDPVPSLDPTRRLGRPTWAPTPATRLASGPETSALLARTADRAAVVTAAELLGVADALIAQAAAYALDRHQFGRPIGSFQAVKHLLAGARVQLEFARPAVYAGAWALDTAAPGASRSASMAKAYASDAADEAARVALQVHGAIGYTWECDLHLFLKRAWALSEAWGSAVDHRARILDSLLDER